MITKEQIQEAWVIFNKIKDEAEQYMIPQILWWDLKLTPLYEDLMKNWDDHHAEVFMNGMKIMFRSLGVE